MSSKTKTTAVGTGVAALLMSGSVAASEVELHGIIDVFVGSTEAIGADDSTEVLGAGGRDTSYWGISASHELDGGLTVVGDLEAFFRPDTADMGRFDGDSFFARSANVGLQGGFGEVRGGRITAPLYLPMVFTNPFGGSFVFSPANFHTYAGNGPAGSLHLGDSGWDNSVRYTSPNISGLTMTAQYAFGENEGESGENRIGGNLVYRDGGLVATAGFHYVDLNTVGGIDIDDVGPGGDHLAAIAGLSYDFGVVQVFGQYQYVDYDLDNENENESFDLNTVTAGVSIPAGPGSVLAAVAYSDATRLETVDADGDPTAYFVEGEDRTTFALGYDYPINDQVTAYATYFRDDVDEDALDAGQTFAAGMQYRF